MKMNLKYSREDLVKIAESAMRQQMLNNAQAQRLQEFAAYIHWLQQNIIDLESENKKLKEAKGEK